MKQVTEEFTTLALLAFPVISILPTEHGAAQAKEGTAFISKNILDFILLIKGLIQSIKQVLLLRGHYILTLVTDKEHYH